MSAVLEHAKKFFHACESAEGWAGCAQYVAPAARFDCVAASQAGVHTVEAYCEQIRLAFTLTFVGSDYKLCAAAHDPSTQTVLIHGESLACHSGEGGPVPASGARAIIPFVYIMKMDENGKLSHLQKIYDEASSRKQLGWPPL